MESCTACLKLAHEMSTWDSNLSLFDLKTHPITHSTLLGTNLEEMLKREVNCCDSQISYVSAGSHVLRDTNNGKSVPTDTDRN